MKRKTLLERAVCVPKGMTEQRARELMAQWLEAWPETKPYFARVNDLVEGRRAKEASLET